MVRLGLRILLYARAEREKDHIAPAYAGRSAASINRFRPALAASAIGELPPSNSSGVITGSGDTLLIFAYVPRDINQLAPAVSSRIRPSSSSRLGTLFFTASHIASLSRPK